MDFYLDGTLDTRRAVWRPRLESLMMAIDDTYTLQKLLDIWPNRIQCKDGLYLQYLDLISVGRWLS